MLKNATKGERRKAEVQWNADDADLRGFSTSFLPNFLNKTTLVAND
jgi:hypothetical protein